MITKLFSFNQFFVQFQAPNADELTSYVMNKSENYTDFDWAQSCQVQTINCPWEETDQLIGLSVQKFSDSLRTSFSYIFHDPWINCYERGSYQEIHSHQGLDFVSVFFPQEQEDGFGQFYFYDRNSNFLTQNWQKVFNFSEVWIPNISSGDIIFFPSTVLHGVKPHQSDKIRKTLSCNFTLSPLELPENK